MSTPNFCRYEASKYYAIGITDETENDEFIYDDTKDNVFYELKTLPKETSYRFYEYDERNMYQLFNRSYGGSYIGSIELSKYICDIEITVIIHAVLSGGYYQGATLDYISEIQIDRNDYNDFENFQKYFDYKDLEYYSELPVGMLKIQSKNIEKFVRFAYAELTGQIEKVYEKFCDVKLVKTAQFSNGEAIYEKAS